MSRSLNKVMLIGYVADEPIIRTFGQGGKVANVTIVTHDRQKNNETGVWEEVAEWHRVTFWFRTAEIVEQYVHKGSQIYVDGKLRTRSYTDKTGVKRYSTEIMADQLILLGSRRDDGSYQSSGTIPRVPPPYNVSAQGSSFGQNAMPSFGEPVNQGPISGPQVPPPYNVSAQGSSFGQNAMPSFSEPVNQGQSGIQPPMIPPAQTQGGMNMSGGNYEPMGSAPVNTSPWEGNEVNNNPPAVSTPSPEAGGGDDDIPF